MIHWKEASWRKDRPDGRPAHMLQLVWKSRWSRTALVVFLFTTLLTLGACGTQSPERIVSDLQKKAASLKGYKASGELTIASGETPLNYKVEAWYEAPDKYRIALENETQNLKQIILKNEDGVFVLTPHLKKSFRFQSDWPQGHGQIYLYQSLVEAVVSDTDRTFTKTENGYLFQVKAQYQNRMLTTQRIWFEAKTLAPKRVEVMDQDDKVLVTLVFHAFTLNPKFNDDDFSQEKNMAVGEDLAVPTAEMNLPSTYMEPQYRPDGVTLKGIEVSPSGKGWLLTYGGAYTYTVEETLQSDQMVMAPEGVPVELDGQIGVLTQNGELKTLRFTYAGMDIKIMSQSLPDEEMVRIALSTMVEPSK
ncbi:MAG: outer membrane lipoprotein carrier protein LolA [Candidatus Carbobacillus altaicus]|nr:outer membrane lipoprotein carrier protein LolA [Candidatus Carbobacillus altaicus]